MYQFVPIRAGAATIGDVLGDCQHATEFVKRVVGQRQGDLAK